MEKTHNTHFFLNELAAKEGMSAKTLAKKLRAKGYDGSLRGLLSPELGILFKELLHPKVLTTEASKEKSRIKRKKEEKKGK